MSKTEKKIIKNPGIAKCTIRTWETGEFEPLYMNIEAQLAEWLRKYQKIEQILDDCDLEAWEILEKIKEVVRA